MPKSLKEKTKLAITRARSQNLDKLNDRHRTIINMLVYGVEGRRLTTDQAADQLRMRRDYVASLMSDPLFLAEHDKALAAKRAAAKPAALDKIIETVHRHGEGGTADARLQYDAARTILGDDPKSPAVQVNVNNQVGVAFRPGYIIRLPAKPDPPTIEAQPEPTE